MPKKKKNKAPQLIAVLFFLVLVVGVAVLIHFLTLPTPPFTDEGISAWKMHDGDSRLFADTNPHGLVNFGDSGCVPTTNGDKCEYDLAVIPASNDPGWNTQPMDRNVPPIDPIIINYDLRSQSYLNGWTPSCIRNGGDSWGKITYFQTFVSIPYDVDATHFTVSFQTMDDGSRVTIFNSKYPSGIVDDSSYIFLGQSISSDLSHLLVPGERNRVVITHVDDCASSSTCIGVHLDFNNEWLDETTTGSGEESTFFEDWWWLLLLILILLLLLLCLLAFCCRSKPKTGGLGMNLLGAAPIASKPKKSKWTVDVGHYIWSSHTGGGNMAVNYGAEAPPSAPGVRTVRRADAEGELEMMQEDNCCAKIANCWASIFDCGCCRSIGCTTCCDRCS